MPALFALILCLIATIVLLRIEFRANPSASHLLWVPTVWAMISGSRPIARWLQPYDFGSSVDFETGSVWDRVILVGLITVALLTVKRRRMLDWARVWRWNWGVLLFFAFIGTSVLWSDAAFVSMKRWIRSAGVVIMGLAVISEANPLQALESVFRRSAYVLIPFSLVLIKYVPVYGRAYGRWNGAEMWTGVSTHKNGLGVLCAVSAFLFVWALLRRGRPSGGMPQRSQKAADLGVLFVTFYLLLGPGKGAYSATSVSITFVGIVLFLLLHRSPKIAGVLAQNLKIIMIVLVPLYLMLGDTMTSVISGLINRNPDLTGRTTDIWPIALAIAARHPILGTGYGGAWGLGGELSIAAEVEQAHNGYLDVYLQLGIVGCILLALFFLTWCTRIQEVFKHDSDWGIFGICFLLMTIIYNLTETAFFDVYLGTAMVLLPVSFAGGRDVLLRK